MGAHHNHDAKCLHNGQRRSYWYSHIFLNSGASHLLSSEVSILHLRDLLEHESVTTTEEYAKVLKEDKFDAIKNASTTNVSNELDD